MRNLTISLDVMGGDFGPLSTIPAAIRAVETYPYLHLILCGDQVLIRQRLRQANQQYHPRLSIQHCEQSISMAEQPAVALRSKPRSSMRKALDLVANKQAQACVSAGNTGALLAIAHYVLKMLPGLKRPALITALPTLQQRKVYILDLGANISCEAKVLHQFALMGSVIAQERTLQPRVALLNVGTEKIKGHEQIKQADLLFAQDRQLNYCGFIEGNDIFNNKADVIVCDGFVGNVALKTCEGVASMLLQQLQATLKQNYWYRILGWGLLPLLKRLYRQMNPEQYNGASLIGLNGVVIKSHGNASADAFFTAIESAMLEVQRQTPAKISAKLALSNI